MPSLTKKIVHGKPYYYLRECQRVNGKPFDSACWKNSSGETTLLEPFDCTSGTSPSSPNIFIVRPINSEPRIFVSTNCSSFRKKSWRGQAITRLFVRYDSSMPRL